MSNTSAADVYKDAYHKEKAENERLRAALKEILDDPLSDIRADMRHGIRAILNQQRTITEK